MKLVSVFLVIMILSTLGLVFHQYYKFHDGKLHVVFCTVGQGDAIFIRTPNGAAILYDGGPDQKILSCLSDHMPFWDRSIELMYLSHPHADHLIGLVSVLKRYVVLSFTTEQLTNDTAMFSGLMDLLAKQETKMRHVLSGDRFLTGDGVVVEVLGPTNHYLTQTSPGGKIGESKEFASLILKLSYKNFSILLTGDSQVAGLEDALTNEGEDVIDLLQVPHHGSATGLNESLVKRLKPKLAIISVGKNKYGHPSKEIISLLATNKTMIKRTDKEGNIEIVSDGKTWWLR